MLNERRDVDCNRIDCTDVLIATITRFHFRCTHILFCVLYIPYAPSIYNCFAQRRRNGIIGNRMCRRGLHRFNSAGFTSKVDAAERGSIVC